MTAILPVTPGQELTVVAGRAGTNDNSRYSGWPDGGDNGFNMSQGGGSSFVTTQHLVASTGCQDLATSRLDRSKILVQAGGGGGGGGGGFFGSGGNGGNAGANADFSGQGGSDAYHLGSDCGYGRGGGGGYATGPGIYGAGSCVGARNGKTGNGFNGAHEDETTYSAVSEGGAGGGGWYGGGSGGSGNGLGGGGGGAGASYVSLAARSASISQATVGPSVTITPLPTPTTTAATVPGGALVDWYTAAPTITLTADAAGGAAVGKTYYAIDNPNCSYATSGCQVYNGPFSVGAGLHTLTYFSVNALGLDEAVQTKSFAVTPTNNNAAVTAADLGSGTAPTAAAGGLAGTPGSVSVSGAGAGVVGAAVYGANPAGTTVFNSSGAFVDVIAAGGGLTGLTILNCHLNGGTTVSWWDGTAWALASSQTYNTATRCVTITVTSETKPSVSQLTGTVFAAGSPPTTTAAATTADGEPYAAGTWTNQTVTVAFTCTENATATASVMKENDGQNQSASGTCTDGLGQKTTTTFTGINVDKTPPTCSIDVSPTVLWSPNAKPVAIAGTVTVGDNLSGIASVVGGAVTSNETLRPGDVRGFAINAPYPSPLRLGAVVDFAGTLVATRAGDGSGRTYSQLITVTDQAGNTNTAPCTWTVTVPHDQRGRH